jgi:hypothetical protein
MPGDLMESIDDVGKDLDPRVVRIETGVVVVSCT